MTFKIVNESILDQQVDAIVNPANTFLNHAGGLARIIADAATARPALGAELRRRGRTTIATLADWHTAQEQAIQRWIDDHDDAPLIPVGSARATSAGRLPFKVVIHAVGPVWGGGSLHEVELLRSAYDQAFASAQAMGYVSIAVPAISAGIFGVPMEVVARVATSSARQFSHKLDITICLTSDEDVALFESFR